MLSMLGIVPRPTTRTRTHREYVVSGLLLKEYTSKRVLPEASGAAADCSTWPPLSG